MKTTKPKILFILHTPPPVHGSAMVGQFIKDSKIINSNFDCRFINLGTSSDITEIGKKSIYKYFKILSLLYKELQYIINFKPQLCYIALTVKGPAFYKDFLFILIAKLFNVKLIYHLHNKGVRISSKLFINRFIYHFVFKNTNAILLSEHLYQDVCKFLPRERVQICPNGIPDTTPPVVNNLTTPTGTIKILFLSNLIQSKGVFVLLEAMFLLKQRKVAFEGFFIGGEGDISAKQFEQKVKELALQKQVKYLGKKYNEDKTEAFNSANIFAFPTYYSNECFPLVLLEAMQHKLAIISTFEGGIRDIVEDGITGFLVPQKNINILADKLEYLINNPELCLNMGVAGRKKYEKLFMLDAFENKLTKIIHDTI